MNLLLDSALKATVILLAAWAASLGLRRASADVRHTVWLAAMLAVAMLPVTLAIPPSAIPMAAQIVVPALAARPSAAVHKLPWLYMMWAAGASLVLARLMVSFAGAVRLTRSARRVDGILYSDRAATPMTWGFLRPVVILPSYASEWTAVERELVIRHERAHIARRDWLWQILASLLTAVFWFHPLMWLAKLQLRREAEGAADDLVLSGGATPSDYAGQLLDVARRMRGIAAPAIVIPMVRRPELEMRVRSILDPSSRRTRAGVLVRCAVALTAAMLIFPIAVTRQKVHAQGKVYKVGEGVSQPAILYKVEPEYSEEARRDAVEGQVRLQVEITPDGFAHDIRVIQSLGSGLDQKAMEAVEQWRFKPGMKDGEPVSVYATIEVNFHLL
jgi:TonB family protein